MGLDVNISSSFSVEQTRQVATRNEPATQVATKAQVETVKTNNDAVKLETSAKSSVETKNIDFVDTKKEDSKLSNIVKNIRTAGTLISAFGGAALVMTAKTGGQVALGIGVMICGISLFNGKNTSTKD